MIYMVDRGTICNLAFVECVHNGAIVMKMEINSG